MIKVGLTLYTVISVDDFSKPNDNKDEGAMSLVEILDNNDKIIRLHVLEFDYNTIVNDMVSNDWSIYCRNSVGSVNLVVG